MGDSVLSPHIDPAYVRRELPLPVQVSCEVTLAKLRVRTDVAFMPLT
jgi:hypothetical protein